MSDIAIRVENLGKQYRLGEFRGYRTFRETLSDLVVSRFRRFSRNGRGNGSPVADSPSSDSDHIWALRDVSFEVKHGEVLGIIGPNGAGKSTLLKILSRITEPSAGYAEIRGRVGSLLEVGTGFHPELTGRENVYLNGSILGMSKTEIRRKFDDIVSFAGVEKFIDTPVKRYSSGMQVRLAFAVAAHLEPEIMIVDEVLAVGDAEFQKRCLGKMDEVSRSGRTILFVSHNMAAVEGLCTRALLLKLGKIHFDGHTRATIEKYFASSLNRLAYWKNTNPTTAAGATLDRIYLTNSDMHVVETFPMGSDVAIHVDISGAHTPVPIELSIRINDHLGRRFLTCNNYFQHPQPIVISGNHTIICIIRNCRLAPRSYQLLVELYLNHRLVRPRGSLRFRVIPTDLYGTGRYLPEHTSVWSPDVDWISRGRVL